MEFPKGLIVVAIFVLLPIVLGDSTEESGLETYSSKPKHVMDLLDQTFGTAIKSDSILIMFYSQSVKASSVLKSVWANAAKQNRPIHPNVIFASLDVDSQTAVADSLKAELGVTDIKQITLPLIRVYSKGEYIRDYKGQLDTNKLAGFLKRLSGPGLVTFSTESQLETFLRDTDRDSTAVGFFETMESDAARNFREVSKRLKGDMDFAMLTLDSGKIKLPFNTFKRIKKLPSLVVYRNFAPPAFYDIDSDPSLGNSAAVAEFCKESADNFVEEITKENIKDEILKKRMPIAIVWVESGEKHKESFDQYLSIYRQVATKFQKNLAFYWAKGPENSQQMKKFGLDGQTFPSVTILDPKTYLHYAFDKEFTRDELVKFFSDFVSAKVEANMKKEAPPAENNGPVTVVVYDTFKNLVLEAKHDVVVIFYTDDSNCRSVLKFYEHIAVALKKHNIELAKINLDLNDTPRHGLHSVITGYPTIKYFSLKTQLSETFKEPKLIPKQLLSWIHAQSGSSFDLEQVASELGYSAPKAVGNQEEVLNSMQEIL